MFKILLLKAYCSYSIYSNKYEQTSCFVYIKKNQYFIVQVKKLLSVKKTTPTPHLQLKQHRHRVQKLRADDRNLDARSVLRSPIVKKLLRISNSIQCEAKDECQDKCSNKFNGKKAFQCEAKCEEKYECEEEEDPCDKDECPDSCGGDEDCPVSTKGERYVTEPSCKKC